MSSLLEIFDNCAKFISNATILQKQGSKSHKWKGETKLTLSVVAPAYG